MGKKGRATVRGRPRGYPNTEGMNQRDLLHWSILHSHPEDIDNRLQRFKSREAEASSTNQQTIHVTEFTESSGEVPHANNVHEISRHSRRQQRGRTVAGSSTQSSFDLVRVIERQSGYAYHPPTFEVSLDGNLPARTRRPVVPDVCKLAWKGIWSLSFDLWCILYMATTYTRTLTDSVMKKVTNMQGLTDVDVHHNVPLVLWVHHNAPHMVWVNVFRMASSSWRVAFDAWRALAAAHRYSRTLTHSIAGKIIQVWDDEYQRRIRQRARTLRKRAWGEGPIHNWGLDPSYQPPIEFMPLPTEESIDGSRPLELEFGIMKRREYGAQRAKQYVRHMIKRAIVFVYGT